MIGKGALAIWMELAPAGEADVNTWYPRQHLPERLSVPGFLRGRRYAAVGGGPPYFTLYETADADVLSSAEYLERLNNPTDWTRRALGSFRRMWRNVYRLIAASPEDTAERHLVSVRIVPGAGRGPAVKAWLGGEALAGLEALPGVTGAAAYESDSGGTSVVTEERRTVGGEVGGASPFVALLELGDESAAPAVAEFWQAWGSKLAAEATVDHYRLMYGLRWL